MASRINRDKFKGLFSLGRYVKWVLIFAGASFCGLIVAGVLWLYLNPISKFESQIKKRLKDYTHAEKISWKTLRWGFQSTQFNLGIHGESVVFENGKGFNKIIIPEMDLTVSFWKLILLKFPMFLDLKKPFIELRQEISENKKQDDAIEIPDILSHLRLNIRLTEGRLLWNSLVKNEIYDLRELNLNGVVAGVPGSFSFQAEFNPALNIPSLKLIGSKSMSLDVEGYTSDFAGKLMRIDFDKIEFNFDDSLLLAGGFLEKVPGVPFNFRAKSSLVLEKNLSVDSFYLSDGVVELSELYSKLHFDYKSDIGSNFDFSLARDHYKKLRLPFKYLRNLEMDGVIESGIVYQAHKGKEPYVKWKIDFNTLKADLKNINPVSDSFSEGPFEFSFLSQGTLENGNLKSPRTEFLINATDGKLSFNNEQILKQKGERFLLEGKIRAEKNQITLDRLVAKLHTLEINGAGKMENVSQWLKGDVAPAKFSLYTNRVNLRDWANVFRFINQSPPLEGAFEVAGEINAEFKNGLNSEKPISWKIDKAYASGVKGLLNPVELTKAGYLDKDSSLDGVFSADILCSARGEGSVLSRGNMRAIVDLSDLAFVWKKKFQKEQGVPLKLTASIDALQNEINIQQAKFQFHTLVMSLTGKLRQGSGRSSVMLNMAKPVELGDWKKFFPQTKVPLQGQIAWNGLLGFAGAEKSFSNNFDFKKVALRGSLNFNHIRGRLPDSETLIRDANANLKFSDQGVSVDKASVRFDDNQIELQGSSTPLKSTGRWLSVSDILATKTWEHKYIFKMHHFIPSENSKAESQNKNEKPFDLIEILRNPYVKGSVYDLGIIIEEGKLGGVPFKKLKAKASWKNSQLVMNPIELKALRGELRGSANINAQDFYLRNQDPTFSSTLRVNHLNIGDLIENVKPEMKGLLGGSLDGGVILSGEGILFDDLIKKSSGRLQGRLSDGYFETFKILKGQLDDKVRQGELNKWLAQEAKRESCLQSNFVADLDAEIRDGSISVSQSKILFTKTQSKINMKGDIDRQLNINMKGNFFAGDSCVNGDLRACLSKNKEGAAVPFYIQGPASQAQAKLDYAGLTRQIGLCIKDGAKEKLVEKVQSEIKKSPEIKKAKDQAVEQIKNIFKGR
jgi:hypothetical protein